MRDSLERFKTAYGGRYAIEDRVGRGGMAEVYRAADLKHARTVAVKFLRPEIAAGVGTERFLREIRIAAQLQHPNILPVYDSGDADGALFYIMPYVEGDSLRALMRRSGKLPLADVLRIAAEVGDALSFAHKHNVVHRDVKPENVLFSSGHAMVADFGIARAIESAGADRLTELGFGLGTPEYMSPEQAFGERDVDARSDIYSLACVLYEMLSGDPPYSGQTVMSTLMRKMRETAPRLSARPALAVPAHIDAAIAWALARDPDARPRTVADFVSALSNGGAERVTVDRARTTGHTVPRPGADRSIAVLPLANLSGDPQNEFLSDGLSDELIHALAKVEGLRVVARTSAFAFKGHREDVRTIGERLKVGTVLEGSLRRAGNRLRITVQLIDASTGFEMWSERYDRELRDVFEMQDEITRAVVDSLKLELLAPDESLVETPTDNVVAYERYLQGRFEWNRRTESALRRSVTLIREALELDPSFVPALSALAESHVTLAVYGSEPAHIAMPLARDAAERALANRPRHGEALSARACVRALFDWNWRDGEADFRRAIELNPQYPTTFQWYATNLLVPLGRLAEARRQLERARELDPLSLIIAISEGLTHYYGRDFERAARSFSAIIEREPSFGIAHYFLATVDAEAGRASLALDRLQQAVALAGESPEISAAMGVAHARAGDVLAARRVAATLKPDGRYVSPVLRAQIHAVLGESNAALIALEEAVPLRATDLAWIGVRPMFDTLRPNRRFARIIEQIGLTGTTER